MLCLWRYRGLSCGESFGWVPSLLIEDYGVGRSYFLRNRRGTIHIYERSKLCTHSASPDTPSPLAITASTGSASRGNALATASLYMVNKTIITLGSSSYRTD